MHTSKWIILMNNVNKVGIAATSVAAIFFSGISTAEEKAKPGFHPSVSATYISDDNIYRQASSKVSDGILTVSPELLFVKAKGKHRFTTQYNGDYASYGKKSSENYSDHFLKFGGLFDFSRKFQANLDLNYSLDHESRDSAGYNPATPDAKQNTFTENGILAGFTYGRRTAKAQFEMDVTTNNLDYTNNSQDSRDRKSNALSARVFYNIGAKSSVFIEAKQNTIDYVTAGARNLDNKEAFTHLGFRWDVSNKTTGELKFGSFTKKFDSAAETDGSGSSYKASILWKPKTYSHVTLAFSQAPQESVTVDSFYLSSLMSVNWQHNFSSKLGLEMGLSSGTDEYSSTRKDTVNNLRLSVIYKLRRRVELGANYTNSKRDSNLAAADFNNGTIMFTAKWIKR